MLTAAFVAVFVLGVAAGWIAKPGTQPIQRQRPADSPGPEQQAILVKRTRASFRNPARTAVTTYDQYKTSRGLYAPVRPGKGSTADEKTMK